jgi:glycosyltransferase involved in cell wall biosynthesis
MQASIIIPTYNRRETVLRSVATLLEQDFFDSDYEVIVVVDGARDGTAEALRSMPSNSKLQVIEQDNRGPSSARNAGARRAMGNLLIFVDDDMTCVPGLVGAHVAAHAAQPGLVGMGAIYVSPDNPANLAADYFAGGLGGVYKSQCHDPGRLWPEGVWSFANTSVQREKLIEVGGFDERFRMREDAELGVRLFAAGLRPRIVAGAIAYHRCDKSASELSHDSEEFAEADLLFMRSHPGAPPQEFVRLLEEEGNWKRRVRSLAATNLAIADLLLAPLCAMGEQFHAVPVLRLLGLRALQIRCGLHWYHRTLELLKGSVQD